MCFFREAYSGSRARYRPVGFMRSRRPKSLGEQVQAKQKSETLSVEGRLCKELAEEHSTMLAERLNFRGLQVNAPVDRHEQLDGLQLST